MKALEFPRKCWKKIVKSDIEKNSMVALIYILEYTWFRGYRSCDKDIIKEKLNDIDIDNILIELKNINIIDYDNKRIKIVDPESFYTDSEFSEKELEDLSEKIADFWNQQNIIKHSKRTIKKIRSKIKSAIKSYGYNSLKNSISNYGKILNSNNHWYSYAHSLEKFLDRKVDTFMSKNRPFQNYRKRQRNINHNPNHRNPGSYEQL